MNQSKKSSFVVICLLVCLPGCRNQQSNLAPKTSTIEITMSIEFQGRQDDLEFVLIFESGASVFEVLQKAQENGLLEFKNSGRGETAFVNSINGVDNERAAGSNWLFFVNNELANSGSDVIKLKDGDRVTWRFSSKYP